MAEQSTILDTIKTKLIQANTDTTSTAGRTAIAKDITKLLQQLNNIGSKQTTTELIFYKMQGTTADASNIEILLLQEVQKVVYLSSWWRNWRFNNNSIY